MREFLARHRRIALDTSVFIYNLEDYPRYADLSHAVFVWLERPGHSAVTSTLTFTELLVRPYRDLPEDRVSALIALLSAYPNLEWVAPDLQIAGRAAQLRAAHRFRTPDAVQAATARSAPEPPAWSPTTLFFAGRTCLRRWFSRICSDLFLAPAQPRPSLAPRR